MNRVPKLRFPEFSGEWENVTLEQVAYAKGRIGWKNLKQEEYTKEGPFLIAGKHIKNGKIRWEKCDHITKIRYDESPEIALKNGDVIFSKDGSLGNPALIEILTSKATINGTMMLLRCNTVRIFPKYLYHIMCSQYFEKLLLKVKSGSSIPHIFQRDIINLKFPLPTLLEQEKIAMFLSSVDKKIELLEEKKEKFEQYKKGMMQKIFSQEIRFKDENGNEYPQWEEKRLGEICNITTGKLDANAMIKNGKYRFYTCAKDYSYIDNYAFDTDALLISGNGANVGYIHHYNGKFNAYQRTYVLDQFKQKIIFIKYSLEKYLKKRINIEKNEGNTPYIILGTLKDMKILLPSLKEQEKIANIFSSIDYKIEITEKELEGMKEFKKGLLQGMFV